MQLQVVGCTISNFQADATGERLVRTFLKHYATAYMFQATLPGLVFCSTKPHLTQTGV